MDIYIYGKNFFSLKKCKNAGMQFFGIFWCKPCQRKIENKEDSYDFCKNPENILVVRCDAHGDEKQMSLLAS